jgi:hypothetical protein
MSKKYTCAGMNCGGRVKGYADGGLVVRAAAEGLGRIGGAEGLKEMNSRMKPMKHVSEEVDDAVARQKASDDRSRMGKRQY